MKAIPEYSGHTLSREQFETEILATKQPVVIRNLVADWELVKKAKLGLNEVVNYIYQHDTKAPCYTVVAQPAAQGRLFYSQDLTSVNFQKINAALTATIEQLVAIANTPEPHAVSVQAAALKECLPYIADSHAMPILDAKVAPTLWLSNQSRVAAHFDLNDNIACVASGKRRFTLFPPDQVSNLYVGPTLNSPGGVPTSMVDLQAPDLERFPRFETALEHALQAELNPGDAIFIPTPWWHSVESLEPLNILINYWWNDHIPAFGPTPNNSMMMAMLTIAKLDPAQRQAWKDFFDYFVFKTSGDPAEHLPENLNDLATQLTDQQLAGCYEFLRQQLK